MRSPAQRAAVLCVTIAASVPVFASEAKAQDLTRAPQSEVTEQAILPVLAIDLRAADTSQPVRFKLPEQPVARQTTAPSATWKISKLQNSPARRPNRAAFILMSAAVYGAATLDMHETMSLRPNLIEHDPLARPFTRLAPPEYYACGYALTTAVNLIAWRMMRSARWHDAWWLPQATSIAGNDWGYTSTLGRLAAEKAKYAAKRR
jgi:hypothetical protein